jgi:hypothetical protein
MNKWNKLSENDKIEYKKIFDEYIGDCNAKCETGEPLYFAENGNMYQTDDLVDFFIKHTRMKKLEKLNDI